MSSTLSAGVLGGTFFLGVPLNGGTVLIFLRQKKLRHLVNFLLLLDSISHLLVTFLVIPTRVLSTVTLGEVEVFGRQEEFVGNFANIHGTLLTMSIGILRYRRLCWKKKDGFGLRNGLKWSLASGLLALGLALAQSGASEFHLTEDDEKRAALVFYAIKSSLSISSVFVLVWCYAGVCWRILGNPRHVEKQRRSRSVHIRATVHSVIQVLLLTFTIATFIYTQTLHLPASKSTNQKLNLLYGTTANYALLVTGTPLAYLASCHRFREQFASLFFGGLHRSFFHRISTEKKQGHHAPKMHLISSTARGKNNRMKHQVLNSRRPSTPRTLMTSTTSSSTSSAAANSITNGRANSIKQPHLTETNGNPIKMPHLPETNRNSRVELSSEETLLSLIPEKKANRFWTCAGSTNHSPGLHNHHYNPPVDFI